MGAELAAGAGADAGAVLAGVIGESGAAVVVAATVAAAALVFAGVRTARPGADWTVSA